MLTHIELEHFKCFELLKLPLGPLTLLSGANASGKSSALQALVVLHQTLREQEWSTSLLLNGSDLRLGTVADVIDKVSGRKDFGIAVADGSGIIRWTFEGDRRDMSAGVGRVQTGTANYPTPTQLQFLVPPEETAQYAGLINRLKRLGYLTAERLGPQDIYRLADPSCTLTVGARGENAVSVLHWGRDERVLDGLAIEGVPPTRLRQVEARMRAFFPGCTLDIQKVPLSNSVTLGLRTSDATGFHNPVHVGFGLTQVLPIVIAALSAGQDGLLVIENPEVHLHPAGQSQMGVFLAEVTRAGVQLIVETHSDHLLNGVRRAVKTRRLGAEEVVIHFFRDRDAAGGQVLSPALDTEGNLDMWPAGFFDQFDRDMNYFAGWGE